MPGPDASAVSASAYDAIVGALASTARGRAFLAEHARRTRADETRTLLDAIAKLDTRLDAMRQPRDHDGIRAQTEAVEAAIRGIERHLRPEWLGAHPGSDEEQPRDLPDAARLIAASIVEGVEGLQDTAWAMREAGFDAELCDRLDRHAAALSLAGAGSEAVASTLPDLARAVRIAAMETVRLTALAGGRPAPLLSPDPEGALGGGLAGDLEFPSREGRPDWASANRSGPSSGD